ncbi:MAG: BTAD domain-containing putative transcriptional regulator [Dongiaceae bacterium]
MRSGDLAQLAVLGPLGLRDPAGHDLTPRGSKAQCLLGYLALQPDRSGSRQRLIGLLWADRAEVQARASLRTCLFEIRSALRPAGLDLLIANRDTVRLRADACVVDAERLLEEAGRAGRDSPTPPWAGELLSNLDGVADAFDEWLFFQRAALVKRYCSILEPRIAAALADGQWELAAALAERVCRVDPTSEAAHRAQIVSHARRGDLGSAYRQYEALREILARTLETSPSPETQRLISQLRAGRAPPGGAGAQAAVAEAEPMPAAGAPPVGDAGRWLPPFAGAGGLSEGPGGRSARPRGSFAGVPLRTNLPTALTPFVGRVADLAALEAMMRDDGVRLVTLTGPGGSGKTRLSLELAGRLADRFADGVFQVVLSAVSDPELVLPSIGLILGIFELPGRSALETLRNGIGRRQILLVLDNFEQLVVAGPLLLDLLDGCPRLKILVTSREALNIAPEREYQVRPLQIPDPGQATLEALMRCDAVRLFESRVRDIRADYQVTAGDVRIIAAICRQLDCLPLAIEIAASRLRILDPPALLERLGDRLSARGREDTRLAGRHRTLHNAIEWSHNLLSPHEQELFRRVAVFAGGFTIAGVQAVCGEGADPGSLLDRLASLVRKSLMQPDPADPAPRLRMLDTVREYARGRLRESGEEALICRRHLACMLALVEDAARRIVGPQQRESVALLRAEADDIAAAFDHAVAVADVDSVARLLDAMLWMWIPRGRFIEAKAWATRAWERLAPLADPRQRAAMLDVLGWLRLMSGDWAGAHPFFRECRPLFERLGAAHRANVALMAEGITERAATGDPRGLAQVGESLRRCRAAGDEYGAGLALTALGEDARLHDDDQAALGHFAEALRAMRAAGNTYWTGALLENLAHVHLRMADWRGAIPLLAEALELAREYDNPMMLIHYLAAMGQVAALRGRPEHGALLLGATAALLDTVGVQFEPADDAAYRRNLEAVRARLGPDRFQDRFSAGRSLGLAEALAVAEGQRGA